MTGWVRLLLLAMMVCFPLTARAANRVEASTELREEDGTRHDAAKAFDGLLSTGWAEGEDGPGAGSWIELTLDRTTTVISVSVWPGNLSQGKQSIKQYGRPRTITVTLKGSGDPVIKQVRLEDGATVGPQRIDVPIRGDARSVRIALDDCYEGIVYNDTYIAEVALNFAEGEPHPWVGKIFAWLESEAGVREREKDREAVVVLGSAVLATEEGDREAFAELKDRAGDGAPYMRKQVDRYVPLGFRLNALPPDENAIEALLKIKDPNAIPALERASLRVLGHEEHRLQQQVEMFYAYQELVGGPNFSVPNWGQSGWSPGELQSFGEPLAIAVDSVGQVLVADTGNSRIQRFSPTGALDRVWGGPEADIANAWIGDTRRWYVSGSAPGEGDGQFTVPLGVVVLPGKNGDGFAAVDTTGRIQVFDAEGAVVRTIQTPVYNTPIYAGVGGQAYLLLVGDNLVLSWLDDVLVYTLEGEEVDRWKINDGVPAGATALKKGKIGFVFEDRLVMYSIDGFRHGSLLGDELEAGFESWDVTTDQDDRLWVLTDTGMAYKYKKPGKLDYAIEVDSHGFVLPRLAVREDMLYICEDEQITVVDALKVKREAEMAAGE